MRRNPSYTHNVTKNDFSGGTCCLILVFFDNAITFCEKFPSRRTPHITYHSALIVAKICDLIDRTWDDTFSIKFSVICGMLLSKYIRKISWWLQCTYMSRPPNFVSWWIYLYVHIYFYQYCWTLGGTNVGKDYYQEFWIWVEINFLTCNVGPGQFFSI